LISSGGSLAAALRAEQLAVLRADCRRQLTGRRVLLPDLRLHRAHPADRTQHL